MIISEEKIYQHGAVTLKGWIFYTPSQEPKPGIIVAHDWTGCGDMAKERARLLAEQGYVAFAIDMYGEGRMGQTNEEKQALMLPIISNRALLRERMIVALTVLKESPQVKANYIAAIGFCFGGLCVLDLARTGADIKAVVSFHGLLHQDTEFHSKEIKANVLVLHGYDDPMVSSADVQQFCAEMTTLKAKWQMNIYGNTSHAFTNPLAHDHQLGLVYEPDTARKAFQAMDALFSEVL